MSEKKNIKNKSQFRVDGSNRWRERETETERDLVCVECFCDYFALPIHLYAFVCVRVGKSMLLPYADEAREIFGTEVNERLNVTA